MELAKTRRQEERRKRSRDVKKYELESPTMTIPVRKKEEESNLIPTCYKLGVEF